MNKILLLRPPEFAVASVAAEGCCAAAEGGEGFDYRLERRALPHQAIWFQVVPEARQLLCQTHRERNAFYNAHCKMHYIFVKWDCNKSMCENKHSRVGFEMRNGDGNQFKLLKDKSTKKTLPPSVSSQFFKTLKIPQHKSILCPLSTPRHKGEVSVWEKAGSQIRSGK